MRSYSQILGNYFKYVNNFILNLGAGNYFSEFENVCFIGTTRQNKIKSLFEFFIASPHFLPQNFFFQFQVWVPPPTPNP